MISVTTHQSCSQFALQVLTRRLVCVSFIAIMATKEDEMACGVSEALSVSESKYTDQEVLAFIASGEQLIDEEADAVVAYNVRRARHEVLQNLPFTQLQPVRRIDPALQQPFRMGEPLEQVVANMTPAQLDIVNGIRDIIACLRARSPPTEYTVLHPFSKAVASAL